MIRVERTIPRNPWRVVSHLLALSLLLLLSTGWTRTAQSAEQVQTVATSDELRQVLSQIGPSPDGHIIQLQPGTYDDVTIHNLSGPLRLVAADPNSPPRIKALAVQDSRNIHFEGLVFDYEFDPTTTKPWAAAFQFTGSQGLFFDNVVVDGALMQGTGTDGDGYPVAKGLVFIDAENVEIANSVIHSFYVGINFQRSRHITLRDSHLYGMRKDIVTLVQVQDVMISGNHFGSYNRSFAFDDHPDMIQMWSKNTDQPSERVTIRGNLFNAGNAPYSQTIFLRNVLVDRGQAGREMFYRDLTIENNVIINAHRNGLVVGHADGVVIRNNTLIRNPSSERPGMSDGLASPSISVEKASQNVIIENNAAFKIPRTSNATWTVQNNLAIQRHKPGAAGYYKALFDNALAGNPEDLPSFYYRKTGALYKNGIGAPMLKPQP